MVYGPSTRSHAPQVPVDPSEALPCRWTSKGGQEVDRFWGNREYHLYRAAERLSLYPRGLLWICFFPAVLSWKLPRAALTRNSAWRAWRWLFAGGRKATDSSTRIRGVSSVSVGRRQHLIPLRILDDDKHQAADGPFARWRGKIPLMASSDQPQHKHRVLFLDGDRSGVIERECRIPRRASPQAMERVGSACWRDASDRSEPRLGRFLSFLSGRR